MMAGCADTATFCDGASPQAPHIKTKEINAVCIVWPLMLNFASDLSIVCYRLIKLAGEELSVDTTALD